MQEQIVINGQLISYQHFGSQKSGQALIFLHGWRSQKEVWKQVASSMYHVSSIYCIDLPGFGASPAPKITPPSIHLALHGEGRGRGWSVGDYAQTVKGFIEKLELKNVILVGHSFGGRVGIKLCAAQNQQNNNSLLPSFILREGTIQKLVLVDSAGFAMDTAKKSLMAGAAKIAKPFFKLKFMQGVRKKIYQTIGAEDYLATPQLQKTFINITSEDLTEDMRCINIPTLIITGENDKDTPVAFGQRMNSLIPNSKFVILPNAGHYSFLDKPEEFVEALKEFI